MIAYKTYHANTKLGLGARCPLLLPLLPQSYRPSSFFPQHRRSTTYPTAAAASTPSNSEGSREDLCTTTNSKISSPPSQKGDHIIADTSDEEKYLPDDPQGLDEELILDPKVTISDVYKNTKMKKKKKEEEGSEGDVKGEKNVSSTTTTTPPPPPPPVPNDDEEEYVIMDDEDLPPPGEGLSFQFKAGRGRHGETEKEEEGGMGEEEREGEEEGTTTTTTTTTSTGDATTTEDKGDDTTVKNNDHHHHGGGNGRELLEAVKAKVKKSAEDREPIDRINKRVIDAFLDQQAKEKQHLASSSKGVRVKPLSSSARNNNNNDYIGVSLLEIILGRAAGIGLVATVISEKITHQSVLSQLIGSYEGSGGGGLVEGVVPEAKTAAVVVMAVSGVWTVVEKVVLGRERGSNGGRDVWVGRVCMGVFMLVVLYETWYSNRPLF
jgi:hypothetical protein